MRIDLHTHSRASDGTESPGDLVIAAAAAGLDVVAVTDHDTTSGWAEAVERVPQGLTVLRGAELSCRYEGVPLHLLAYLFDPAHPGLREQMDHARDDRVPRAREITRRLAEAGHAITWDDVLARVEPGGTVGRPHIADTLVANGVRPDRSAVFADLLHDAGPFYVEHFAMDPMEAVRLVADAGGVTVWAHPFARKRGQVVPDGAFADMAAAGLDGIEVEHRDNNAADRLHLLDIAREHGLLTTGSSDYHGSGKPNRLGENVTSQEAYDTLVGRATGRPIVTG